jgi:hypothetical protein
MNNSQNKWFENEKFNFFWQNYSTCMSQIGHDQTGKFYFKILIFGLIKYLFFDKIKRK